MLAEYSHSKRTRVGIEEGESLLLTCPASDLSGTDESSVDASFESLLAKVYVPVSLLSWANDTYNSDCNFTYGKFRLMHLSRIAWQCMRKIIPPKLSMSQWIPCRWILEQS